jgi:hypothetical protein
MRRSLGLSSQSKIVAVACEGATDPDVFRRLIGEEA